MLSIIFLKNETRPMINYGELESNSGESQAERTLLAVVDVAYYVGYLAIIFGIYYLAGRQRLF